MGRVGDASVAGGGTRTGGIAKSTRDAADDVADADDAEVDAAEEEEACSIRPAGLGEGTDAASTEGSGGDAEGEKGTSKDTKADSAVPELRRDAWGMTDGDARVDVADEEAEGTYGRQAGRRRMGEAEEHRPEVLRGRTLHRRSFDLASLLLTVNVILRLALLRQRYLHRLSPRLQALPTRRRRPAPRSTRAPHPFVQSAWEPGADEPRLTRTSSFVCEIAGRKLSLAWPQEEGTVTGIPTRALPLPA